MTSFNEDLGHEAFVEWAYSTLLQRYCLTEDRLYLTAQLESGKLNRYALLRTLLDSKEFQDRQAPLRSMPFPPGHFYSPIPSAEAIERYPHGAHADGYLPGIDLNRSEQLAFLDQLRPFYSTLPFTDDPRPEFRYHYLNPAYSYGDAIFLHSIIRWAKPKRIVEIGCGYSSCVTLDTNEHFFDNQIRCTFVEPYPELLKSLVRPTDHLDLIPQPLQDVPLHLFGELGERDILFIDSTHVAKLNSDVVRLFFEILPTLGKGVLIHIHDVFYPFEYPLAFYQEGRAWNEQYVLRAFLQYNQTFRVKLFTNYLVRFYPHWFEQNAPLVLQNPGGSLWLEKVR